MLTFGFKNKVQQIKSNLSFLSNFLNLGFIQVSNAVIQILLFPLIIHIVGLEKFGAVMVANSIASLAGLIVNYGTGLSGIKDITLHKTNPTALSGIVYNVFFTRLFLFMAILLALPVLYFTHFNLSYLLLAVPIVLTEIINPLFFFTGIEKLFLYNLANLISKLTASAIILFMIKSQENAPWVNFYLGSASLFFYLLLSIYTIKKFRLGTVIFDYRAVICLLKNNFYLVGNNISVQLQQSFFLFAIALTHNPLLLGAYSLCDKIVWSFRLILTAFSGAVFPKAVRMYHENKANWQAYKRKTNQYLALFFILAGLVVFFLSPLIARVLTGKDDALTSSFIRAISFVPFVSSMNVLNVLDLLIQNKYGDIFKIAMVLLSITILVSLLLITFSSALYFGYYPLIIETCAIPLYLYFIKKYPKSPI
ncbi:MAG: hypothetical protein RLZZ28_707 [Bacteroidota bacterium]